MVAVAFIAFLLFQYVGDPVVFLLGQDANARADPRAARRPGARQALLRAVLALPGQRGARRVRPEPAPGRQGVAPDRRALPGHAGTGAGRRACWRWLIGIPMGVYTALRRGSFLSQVFMTISLLGVSLPTFLIGILLILVFAVHPRLVPQLRPRRDRAARLVDHRPAQGRRLASHRAAGDHAGDLPADADHAAGARRDARGAAHRLHQVRPRARACPTAPSTSAMR